VGDETGTIKFVKWVKADLPDLENGKSYLLKNLVTDEFQGRFSVKLNRTSQIEPLDVDVEISNRRFSGLWWMRWGAVKALPCLQALFGNGFATSTERWTAHMICAKRLTTATGCRILSTRR
jgi:hypothetical protein